MSRWFRHYAGMMRDDKLVRVSIKSKQTVERVCWVWCAILESAAEIDDNGRYEIEHEEIARYLRCPASKVAAIETALAELGRVTAGNVVKWSSRQFTSDRSAARTKAYRERHRDSGVTSQERHCDAPELETETESSVAKATGASAEPLDDDARLWADGKSYLSRRGVKNPGGLIGKWIKDHGKPDTAMALTQAQLERPGEVVPFIEGWFRRHSSRADEGALC